MVDDFKVEFLQLFQSPCKLSTSEAMVCSKFKGLAQQVCSEVLCESYYSQELLPCSTVLALSFLKIRLAQATRTSQLLQNDPRIREEFLKVLPIIIMSSKYTRHFDHCTPASTSFTNLWKVAGALHRPNCKTLNLNSPSSVEKAVLA